MRLKRPLHKRERSMRGKRIGVLTDGPSGDGEPAGQPGESLWRALVDLGYDAVRVFADRDLDLALRATPIDLAFLALSQRRAGDGSIQGLLELLGIHYTGS